MIEQQKFQPASVIGPLGELLTLATLPSPNSARWVIRRKAEVVSAVKGGLLSADEACERYGLTAKEFASWRLIVDEAGMQGLRATRVGYYRELYRRRQAFRCASQLGRVHAT